MIKIMSSKKKRIPRRKSQILDSRTQVASNEQEYCDENDELNQLYQNKRYQPPEIKRFETIYELSSKVRRGLIEEDGTLKVGRGLGHRFIDFASIEYWRCDDKERNKKRKAMVTKQFKGRKRNKTEPLSDKAYDELFEMIANKEDSITESDSEQNEEVDCLNVSTRDLSFPETDLPREDSNREYVDDNSKLDQLKINSDSNIYPVEPLSKSSDTSLSSSTVTKLSECPLSMHLCNTTFNLSCKATYSSSTEEIRPEDQNKMRLSVRGSNCVRRSARIKSSTGLGVNSGHVGDDISMPAVARRSLSGDMVPRRSGEFGVSLISTQDDV